MLRKIRIAVSLAFFLLIALFFTDFAGWTPAWLHALTDIQFIPALLQLNLLVLAGLILLTFVFGRVYCSSICPLGVFQDLVTALSKRFNKRKRFKFKKAHTVLRWSFLGATVTAFLFGFTFLVGFLDPYSAFGRMDVHLFKPVYLAGNNLLNTIFTSFGNHTFYKVSIYILDVFSLLVALITLVVVGFFAWKKGRLYCNTVCPVGTFLGLISRFSIFQIRINENDCNSCGKCSRNCKASCIDSKTHTVDMSRCVNCFDCIDVCSQDAMSFTYKRSSFKLTEPLVDKNKRSFLKTVGIAGIASTQAFADSKLIKTSVNKAIRTIAIMPPGAAELTHFQQKCTSCHLCVSKCPSHVIQPSLLQYGLGGIMQPMLTFEKGFCNYDCTICSDVCPTDALTPLTKEQKHITQLGQVHFIHENCIVVTDGTNCGACSEHCPTQAVSMVHYKDDLTIPYTRTEICVGCGGCEYVCPALPHKAIYVEGLAAHNKITLVKDKVEDVKVDDFGF